MPGRNGTGPLGKGPMSGRGMGFCPGNATNGRQGMGFGRGMGMGRGMGRRMGGFGRGMGFCAANSVPQEGPSKEALEKQLEFLESLVKDVKGSLAKMDEPK